MWETREGDQEELTGKRNVPLYSLYVPLRKAGRLDLRYWAVVRSEKEEARGDEAPKEATTERGKRGCSANTCILLAHYSSLYSSPATSSITSSSSTLISFVPSPFSASRTNEHLTRFWIISSAPRMTPHRMLA